MDGLIGLCLLYIIFSMLNFLCDDTVKEESNLIIFCSVINALLCYFKM